MLAFFLFKKSLVLFKFQIVSSTLVDDTNLLTLL